jgi:hypothetical protein
MSRSAPYLTSNRRCRGHERASSGWFSTCATPRCGRTGIAYSCRHADWVSAGVAYSTSGHGPTGRESTRSCCRKERNQTSLPPATPAGPTLAPEELAGHKLLALLTGLAHGTAELRAFYAAWRSELASNLGFYVGAGDENRTRTISLGI